MLSNSNNSDFKKFFSTLLTLVTGLVLFSGLVTGYNYGNDNYETTPPGEQEVLLVDGDGYITGAWEGNTSGIFYNSSSTWEKVSTNSNKVEAIQRAVDNATATSHTVIVGDGNYNGSLTIDNSELKKLKGYENYPKINGEELGHTVDIQAKDLKVTGLNITNSSESDGGVYAYSQNNITIENNTFADNHEAVFFLYVDDGRIEDNHVVRSYKYGIHLKSSDGNIIEDNVVEETDTEYLSADIYTYDSKDNVIRGNNISGGFYGIELGGSSNHTVENNSIENYIDEGVTIVSESHNNTLRNNYLANNEYGINIDGSDNNSLIKNTVKESDWYGIKIEGSSDRNLVKDSSIIKNKEGFELFSGNTSIVNNTFEKDGIFLEENSNLTIENNTVGGKDLIYIEDKEKQTIENETGQIILNNCTDFTIRNQNITDTDYGITLHKTNRTEIVGSNISGNELTGIRLYKSNYNTVAENVLARNEDGINLEGCKNNTVNNNLVEENDWNGLELYDSTENTQVVNNNLTENNKGINILSSDENRIYLNSLKDNSDNNAESDSSNYWISSDKIIYDYNGLRYSKLGNFWGDYTETDSDGDGIGETAYSISGDTGEDTKPLVKSEDNYPTPEGASETDNNYSLFVESDISSQMVEKEQNATYRLFLKNTGKKEDTYIISTTSPRTTTNLSDNNITLASGESMEIKLNVSSETGGTFDTPVTVLSNVSGQQETIELSTKVRNYRFMTGLDTSTIKAKPEVQANISLDIKNVGNSNDTYSLDVPREEGTVSLPSENIQVASDEEKSVEIGLSDPEEGVYNSNINVSSLNSSEWSSKTVELTVTSEDDHGVSLNMNSEKKKIEKNGEARFNVTVRNTGNTEDTFELSKDSEKESSFEKDELAVEPGESNSTLYTVKGGNRTGSYSSLITASSTADDTVSSEKTVLTKVVPSLSLSTDASSLTSTDSSVFKLKIENTGTETHDYSLDIADISEKTVSELSRTKITGLEPGESESFDLKLENNETLAGQESKKLWGTVKAQVDSKPHKSGEVDLNTIITEDKVHGVSLSSETVEQVVNPGETAEYLLTVRNLGNTNKTIELNKSESKGSLEKQSVTLNRSGVSGDKKVVKFSQPVSEPGEVDIIANSSGVKDQITLKTRESSVTNSALNNSYADSSSTVNESTLNSSTISDTYVSNSSISNSQVTDSTINNTEIIDSDVESVSIEGGRIEDNLIKEGKVTVEGTEYELDKEDPAVSPEDLVQTDDFDSSLGGVAGDRTSISGENSNTSMNLKTDKSFVGGSVGIQRSDKIPKDVEKEENKSAQYARVEPTVNVKESTEYMVINLSYTDQWLESEGIEEDDLFIHRYDEKEEEWVRLVEEGTPRFCNGVERITEGNFIVGNVTKFSTYEIKPVASDSTTEKEEEDEEDEEETNYYSSSSSKEDIKLKEPLENGSADVKVRSMNKNQSVKFNITGNSDRPMDLIGFTSKNRQYRLNITANSFEEKPDDLESPGENIYSYSRVEVEGAENQSLLDRFVDLTVRKEWMEEINSSVEDLQVFLYDNNWKTVENFSTRDTKEHQILRVSPSTFSYIAVGLKEKPEANIIVKSLDHSSSISENKDLEIEVTVENNGSIKGNETIELVINENVEKSFEVSLEPGQTKKLTLLTSLEPGNHSIASGEQNTQIEVLENRSTEKPEEKENFGLEKTLIMAILIIVLTITGYYLIKKKQNKETENNDK